MSPGLFSITLLFDAFDGTQCGSENKMHCINGECIPTGGRLFNVATEQCLDNTNPFAWTETANLHDCDKGTILNSINIEPVEGEHVLIKSLGLYEFGSKCLAITKNTVKFEKCDSGLENLMWKMEFVQQRQRLSLQSDFDEFTLIHIKSKQCLTAWRNSTRLQATSNCFVGDDRQVWMFIDNTKPNIVYIRMQLI